MSVDPHRCWQHGPNLSEGKICREKFVLSGLWRFEVEEERIDVVRGGEPPSRTGPGSNQRPTTPPPPPTTPPCLPLHAPPLRTATGFSSHYSGADRWASLCISTVFFLKSGKPIHLGQKKKKKHEEEEERVKKKGKTSKLYFFHIPSPPPPLECHPPASLCLFVIKCFPVFHLRRATWLGYNRKLRE